MNGPMGERIWTSMIGERIWALWDDEEAFKREVREYFKRGYPGFSVVRAKYPYIYIQDDRGRQA
ncbi:hypothetical protein J2Z22_001625 [Paenibacillus forsythiae]|uniref:Uncharacterized protein n=1 Tax=Paenibacillus forsythiae TaxID=365616 RepID=A0ABU3H8V1_9BACL|nr:hypothetical protein [Paenibacillus forsythiae]MDT3426105.1 hypothetical protein [Paenibacillus forsythiae]